MLSNLKLQYALDPITLIVPLGISFYTFRLISYTYDVYNSKLEPQYDFIKFFLYVSYFPSLISGPIDKPKEFFSQINAPRIFSPDTTTIGFRQILWGVFKKIVIADNCAIVVNRVFDNYTTLPASSLLLGVIFYSIQLYADFSGYSDIAIGSSRLLGVQISKNFSYPFFSTNMAQFWRNWHVSLTSWLTEYVFTPLNFHFRSIGKAGLFLAILINFIICGLWHGANWTYFIFGLINGLYFLPLIINGTMFKKNKIDYELNLNNSVKMLSVFLLFSFTLIFFRSENINSAFEYIGLIFSKTLFSLPYVPSSKSIIIQSLFFSILLFSIEWLGKAYEFPLYNIQIIFKKPIRYFIYYLLIISIIFYQPINSHNFIYVQF
jgi:D-alanyl-lipoteichoic acid acyltransferase DltB (MBOAT superfamily)